jgi:uncharacterized SAM-binding protein YcdF (DUF218 family)
MTNTQKNISKKKSIIKHTPFLILFCIFIWLLGFFWFVIFLDTSQDLASLPKGDGIIVLTGGSGRIAAGIEALQKGYGKKLLISGVNNSIASETIYHAIGDNGPLSECCIDLGREALDTTGNAREAAFWAAKQNFKSIILITADYHMPRTVIEFKAYKEQFQITHLSVKTDVSWATLALEYSKFLVSLFLLEIGLK